MTVWTHESFCGIKLTPCKPDQLNSEIVSLKDKEGPQVIAHLNVHGFNHAWRDPAYRQFLNRAHIVFCDGFGIRLGARLFGVSLPPRITYAEWFPGFCDVAEREGLTFFFFGGKPGVAECAAAQIQKPRPGLQIIGTQHGYLQDGPETKGLLEEIRQKQPDVLLVGLGMPLQEQWIEKHLEVLPPCVVLPAGAALDYLSGELRRAPRWMTDHGLEWLGRLLIEPRRLWRRYLVGNVLYLLRTFSVRIGIKKCP
jgi:N-acetylglucosaminyldiphosphoundecaprenol N-acetyl-beta-D-mannosaminyltransferase